MTLVASCVCANTQHGDICDGTSKAYLHAVTYDVVGAYVYLGLGYFNANTRSNSVVSPLTDSSMILVLLPHQVMMDPVLRLPPHENDHLLSSMDSFSSRMYEILSAVEMNLEGNLPSIQFA